MALSTRTPQPSRRPASRSTERPFTVGEVLGQVQACLEDHFLPLIVRGEVRDCRRPRNGHLYLTLRDRAARLRVVVFSSTLAHLTHRITDGEELLVWGRITAYAAAGDVQLVADWVEPAGQGVQWALREELRKRLAAEGVFARERKQAVPFLPRSIGVVTSPTGSAVHDVLTTLSRRFPTTVRIAPTRVNGAVAAAGLAAQIARLDGQVDVLLLVRGGGSQEDLAGFDAEPVVRAIAACRTPVVTGIGHEDDVTLADLVADVRAPTPTAAAELAVPRREDLVRDLNRRAERLGRAIHGRVRPLVAGVETARRRLELASPRTRVDRWRELLATAERRLVQSRPDLVARAAKLDGCVQRMQRAIRSTLDRTERALASGALRLDSLSPLRVLARGYSLTTDTDEQPIRSTTELDAGQIVRTRLAEGAFQARVLSIEEA